MISFFQARQIVKQNSQPLGIESQSLISALGGVLAEDIHAPFDVPRFNNSAMDGYVLRTSDTESAAVDKPIRLKIKGTIQAGDSLRQSLCSGESYRIMTGAEIPNGGDAVLPVERSLIESHHLVISQPVVKGENVRFQGEEIHKSDRVLRKESVIHPGSIGFLASLGRDKIKSYRRPRVSLITTGNELTPPGSPLKNGKIYDSNSWMILSSLKEMGITPVSVQRVRDEVSSLRKAIRSALRKSDILILIGGVSSGDYDYVKTVLSELGVRTLFWKVSQKPGKPVYFGRKGKKFIFGLPGNPASVFVCFYEYVFPSLRAMMGFKEPHLEMEEISLIGEIMPDEKKALFLKGKRIKGKVKLLSHQGSHMLSSLCQTDCLLVAAPGGTVIRKGKKIRIHLLP